MKKWTVSNLSELPQIANAILFELDEKIILFKGEMGVGKTTLIKALVKAMGSPDNVNSPTYALVNEYESPKGLIYHFDFYRINHEEEAYDIGWEEYTDSGNYCFIEWPEKTPNLIPQKNRTLEIQKNDEIRTIQLY